MLERRKTSFLATLADTPWWIALVLAVIAYLFMRFGFAALMPPDRTAQTVADGMAQMAWVFTLPFLLAAVVSLLRRVFRGRSRDQRGSLVALRVLPRHRFELLVAEAFGRQGYVVEPRGSRAPDGAVDLELWQDGRKSIVRCRHWQARQVGAPLIRELYDAMRAERADEAIFLSSGHYTHEAWQFGGGKPLRLIDGDGLLHLLAGVWDVPPARAGHVQSRVEPRIGALGEDRDQRPVLKK
ncbi:MAG: restriction endonuclease [Betaproteobacteria bacterium]|nr:restriction endonuclease [Betaproteobacteria bacterium]MDH3435373.1 restriction endonuclease [Betaproteobacteria bacterium]